MKANGGDDLCGMTRKVVVEKGMAYFAQTIQLGEEAYGKILHIILCCYLKSSNTHLPLQINFIMSRGGQRNASFSCSILQTGTSTEQFFC